MDVHMHPCAQVFITNGWMCDVVIVCAKTDTSKGAHGVSLFLVEDVRMRVMVTVTVTVTPSCSAHGGDRQGLHP